jgi:putative transcriptional regulator
MYTKLWETLKENGISQYALIKQYKISTGQLDRLRKNENVSTHTLDMLCKILHCRLEDIAEFVEEEPLP